SFFNDISSETIFTLLPLYIESNSVIGFLGGIINGLGDLTKSYFGYLSDHLGRRRPIVFAGYLVSTIAKLIIPLVTLPFLIPLLLLDRLGKGVREGPRDAILSTTEKKGWAFGLQKSMDTMGAVVGGLLAYFFIIHQTNYKFAMGFAASIGILALVPLLFVGHTEVKKTYSGFVETVKKVSKEMKYLLPMAALFGFVMISPMIFIKESYDQLGSIGILVYVLFNIVYALSANFFGKLSDRKGRSNVLNLSFVSAALAFLFVFRGGWGILVGFTLYGISMGSFRSTSKALVSDIVKKRQATALGLFQTVLGLSVFVGSSIFGILLESIGSTTYLLGALLSGISLGAYNLMRQY
ncbi:MAG: MFS transporter, partial [Candidatus Altiarchaeota archaeon]|nr:MFS transporter [Candidatus Altiarchaeota archaeon]